MMERLHESITRLFSNYWFVPASMSAFCIALGIAMLYLDSHFWNQVDFRWYYINSAEGARSLLSTIAGSVITVAGVSFSVVIVALTVSASQYGPHILSNLMRDRGNQAVLGLFTGTFLYCLIVLRSVHRTEQPFAMDVSIMVAVLLAIVSIGVLIYFIHHVSQMLRLESLVGRVVADVHIAIDMLYPERMGSAASAERSSPLILNRQKQLPLTCIKRGYLQSLRDDETVATASKFDAVIVMRKQPGDFLIPGEMLATAVFYNDQDLPGLQQAINGVIAVGSTRTVFQDVRYPAIQLVGVAMKALSPAINDLLTATVCINELGAALNAMLERQYPNKYRTDESNRVRLIARPTPFRELLELTIGQLVPYASNHFMTSQRLLEILMTLAQVARRQFDLQSIKLLADDILIASESGMVRKQHKTRLRTLHAHITNRVTQRTQQLRSAA